MSPGRKAVTLAELLIAVSLFMLALGICAELALVGIRTRSHAMQQNGELRQVVTVFQQLQFDLLASQRLYQPDVNNFQAQSGVVLVRSDGDGLPQVVGWSWQAEELRRVIYQSGYDPLQPSTHNVLPEHVQRSRGVLSFELRRLPPGRHFGSSLVEIGLEYGRPVGQKFVTTLGLRD